MVKSKSIAIIPARGGSKRIPKKNIIDFMGKPMIAWTIEAAVNSKKFDKIIVSTDNPEIAKIAEQNGIDVPFLRAEKADDYSSISEVIIYALNQAENFYKEEYDIVSMLMPNCPIRDEKDVINAYENFQNDNYDSQISCFQFGFMNPWWAFKLNDDFTATKLIKQDKTSARSQDLENLYCPTGAIWLAKKEKLYESKSFYTGKEKYFELNWKNALDIDNYEDLELAKAVYLIKKGN